MAGEKTPPPMDERFRNTVITRVIKMITPAADDAEVRRMSQKFAPITHHEQLRALQHRSDALWHEVQQRRCLVDPIVEARVSPATVVALVALGALAAFAALQAVRMLEKPAA